MKKTQAPINKLIINIEKKAETYPNFCKLSIRIFWKKKTALSSKNCLYLEKNEQKKNHFSKKKINALKLLCA